MWHLCWPYLTLEQGKNQWYFQKYPQLWGNKYKDCAVLHKCSNICIIHLALITTLSSRETLQYCQNVLPTVSVCFVGQTIVPVLQVGFQRSGRLLACLHNPVECEAYLLETAMLMTASKPEAAQFQHSLWTNTLQWWKTELRSLAQQCQMSDCFQISWFSSLLSNVVWMLHFPIAMLYLTVCCRHTPRDSPASVKGVDGIWVWRFPSALALANAG